jgi:hypothetical protein
LLALRDDYGSSALIEAIEQATAHNAFGTDYIENILYLHMPSLEKFSADVKQFIRRAIPAKTEAVK